MNKSSILSYLQPDELKELQSKGQWLRNPSDLDIIRWAARNYFICFCLAVMPKFQPSRFHILLADKLQSVYERVKKGEDVRLMVEVPPRHGKTMMVSVLWPAWVMGKESWPTISASYGSALAEKNSEQCREIVASDMYQYIFPPARMNPDSTSKEYWRTLNGASYRAAGVGSALTGMGGKILGCDDPFKDRADADSAVMREAAWAWWQSTFFTRRDGKAGVVLLNTRWHMDDLSGRLLQQQEDLEAAGLKHDTWERIRFPAIAEEDEYIDGELFRKAGEALWPERFSLADLEKTRNNTDVYNWSSLYQQQPILSENQEFRSEWFKYYEQRDIERKVFDIYVLWDPAISQKKSADNSCLTTLGKERGAPDIYRLNEKAGRFDPGIAIDHVFEERKKYQNRRFLLAVETVAFQKSLVYAINEEMKKREIYFDVVEVKSTGAAKEDRIRGLIPLYRTGVIWHRKGVDNDYERELLQFPKGKHDDRIDAMAQFLQIGRPTKYRSGGASRYVPKNTTYGGRNG